MATVHVKLLPWQRRMVDSGSPVVIACCGRGSGKSYALSVIAMLDLLRGKDVIICAQRFDSLRDVVFKEVKQRTREWGLWGKVRFTENPVRASYGSSTIYGGSYENIDGLRGLTNISLLLLDELALAPPDVMAVLAPCMRGKGVLHPRIVGATTPRLDTVWNGRFQCPDKYGYEMVRARTRDNVYITEEQMRLIEANILTPEMRAQELEGEILVSRGNNSVCKMTDFSAYPVESADSRIVCGLDCSGGVDRDAHAFAMRQGNRMLALRKWTDLSPFELSVQLRAVIGNRRVSMMYMDKAYGDGVYENIKGAFPITRMNFGGKASSELYANSRAEMLMGAGNAVRNGLCLDCDGIDPALAEEAKLEFTSMLYRYNSQGRILIIPKEELRLILGHSTDLSDAISLSCVAYRRSEPAIRRDAGDLLRKKRREAAAMMG